LEGEVVDGRKKRKTTSYIRKRGTEDERGPNRKCRVPKAVPKRLQKERKRRQLGQPGGGKMKRAAKKGGDKFFSGKRKGASIVYRLS